MVVPIMPLSVGRHFPGDYVVGAVFHCFQAAGVVTYRPYVRPYQHQRRPLAKSDTNIPKLTTKGDNEPHHLSHRVWMRQSHILS